MTVGGEVNKNLRRRALTGDDFAPAYFGRSKTLNPCLSPSLSLFVALSVRQSVCLSLLVCPLYDCLSALYILSVLVCPLYDFPLGRVYVCGGYTRVCVCMRGMRVCV